MFQKRKLGMQDVPLLQTDVITVVNSNEKIGCV